ncbi:MAG: polysaccharide biosynthesis/export family protein [Mariprofundus sp.]|nr:polysaccharide biosynthesis/export family protein [Mariprofundus sp.]
MDGYMRKILAFLLLLLSMMLLYCGAAMATSMDDYKLNAGDKIKIHVFGEPDMDIDARLGSSGNIRYPFLGEIHISGMTMAELEKQVTHDLEQGFLVDPQVRVSMEEFRPFYVNGKVAKPGAYPYQPGLSVRKAVSLAGGLTTEADENKVFLIHADDSKKRENKIEMSAEMGPGDILTVKQSYFFVNGEVKLPGKYPYQQKMTYRMAISMAGGMKERADEDKIYVIHEGKEEASNAMPIDSVDAELQPGDVITIKQSFF